MPLYDLRCSSCGYVEEDRYFNLPKNVGLALEKELCPECGMAMRILPSIPANIAPAWQPYIDPHISPDGEPTLIKGREHRKELMKKYNLVEKPLRRPKKEAIEERLEWKAAEEKRRKKNG